MILNSPGGLCVYYINQACCMFPDQTKELILDHNEIANVVDQQCRDRDTFVTAWNDSANVKGCACVRFLVLGHTVSFPGLQRTCIPVWAMRDPFLVWGVYREACIFASRMGDFCKRGTHIWCYITFPTWSLFCNITSGVTSAPPYGLCLYHVTTFFYNL